MALPELTPVSDPAEITRRDGRFDALVAVGPDFQFPGFEALAREVVAMGERDAHLRTATSLRLVDGAAGGRLVLAPTGPLTRDYDDVRRFSDAAAKGIRRAVEAGARAPVVLLADSIGGDRHEHALEASILGALQALWQPLEAREAHGEDAIEPVKTVAFFTEASRADATLRAVHALEVGRRLARDLGGTEPERMRPEGFARYCEEHFEGGPVSCSVLRDPGQFARDYPLAYGVARASMDTERHHPRVIRLEYAGEGPISKTILLAGKGLTYDTGGADLKVGGVMAGMSRDKGGGAGVAGFLATVALLKPRGVRVIAEIGAVRNSIGPDAFVPDEILTSHAGVRVRIGNTDAEGRLVLADLLSHLREDAVRAENPCLFSVATLTGHAVKAVGPYTIALDNGPAREARTAERLSDAGEAWGDPVEISRLRREDFDFIQPKSRADDVLSCNNAPSSATPRGHQFPMAFLAIASGLDHHGRDAERPLPYTHVDIAGGAVEGGDWQHGKPTGAPVIAFTAALLD